MSSIRCRDLDLNRILGISIGSEDQTLSANVKTEMMPTLFGSCCHAKIEQSQFFEHLAHHKHTLACSKCQFETKDTFELACHHVDCHKRKTNTVREKYRNIVELRYWDSVLKFENGLVLNKFNLIGTHLENSEEFQQFIDSLIEQKMQKYEGEKSNTTGDVIVLDGKNAD